MASSSYNGSEEDPQNYSDDENLAELKRKAENCPENVEKYCSSSDDEPLVPSVLVKVEMGEENEENQIKLEPPSRKKAKVTKKTKTTKPLPKQQIKKKVVKCTDCFEVFDSVALMRAHAIKHEVQTRHKCEECGKCFKKAFGLRTHKRMHGEKNLKCPICDAAFTLNINLGRHIKQHENLEKCHVCQREFQSRKQLTSHLRKTHGIKIGKKRKPKLLGKQQNVNDPNLNRQAMNEEKKDEGSTEFEIEIAVVKREIESDVSNDGISETDESNNVSKGFDGFFRKEDLSYSTQCAIVNRMHKGRSVADICQLYNLTPEVVNEIWEDREEYSLLKTAGRKSAEYMNRILDGLILDWFNQQKLNNVQVCGRTLIEAAENFARENGFVAFNGSKKWLDRFKQRYKICFRPTKRNRDYSNHNPLDCKWKNQFLKEQWLDARVGIRDEDIYTADEVGVYYNPSRGRIKKLAGKKFVHGFAKDRLAIFMCTNCTGRDKKKLIVCGTEDPLIHSKRNVDSLPVTYVRHAQGHFTTSIFEGFVKSWNDDLQRNHRKAVLILDRATIHSKLVLSNLKLLFVPWKASTSLMPIKNGIYTRFREEFRRLILQEKAINVMRGIDRHLTCLEALNMLEKAWRRTPSHVITKCFANIGYDIENTHDVLENTTPKYQENDEEFLCKIISQYDTDTYYHDVSHMDYYMTVDEELLTGQGTNCSVFGGNHKTVDPVAQQQDLEDMLPINSEVTSDSVLESTVLRTRAFQDLEIVRNYLQRNETSQDMFYNLLDVENFLLSRTLPDL